MSNSSYALITGASRGLGAVLATAFWDDGYSLILPARSTDKLHELVRKLLPRPGQEVRVVALDLAHPDAVKVLVAQLIEEMPKLDVLINNAAIQGPIGKLASIEWADWLKVMQINLLSPAALCRSIYPSMVRRGGGKIINVSGGGATSPRPNFSAYSTAKAGLVRFSETLAEELRPNLVRVNCIAPGAMATDMLSEVVSSGPNNAGPKEFASAINIQKQGGASMQRVAELCIFLASDAAKGITGKLISAVWDPWPSIIEHEMDLMSTDIYTLRRILPQDRGKEWGGPS